MITLSPTCKAHVSSADLLCFEDREGKLLYAITAITDDLLAALKALKNFHKVAMTKDAWETLDVENFLDPLNPESMMPLRGNMSASFR